jgi:tetratricopeptide (TPR) repeat protein
MCRLVAVVLLGATLRAEDVAARVQACANLLQRGDSEGAIHECKAALAQDPLYPAAHMFLGQAYLAQHSVSMVAEAKAELQQALELDPSLLWARFYLAKIYIDVGQNAKAKEQLERGLKSRPDVPHFLSLLGDVDRKLGDPDASIELNRKALAKDPTMTPAHYYVALAYLDLKKEELAIRELESALASQYVTPEIYLTLSSLYVNRARLSEAEALCKKAVALDRARPEAHLALAQVYNARGASDQALSALKLVLLDGRSFPATAYYQQLQSDAYFEMARAYQAKRMKSQAIDAYTRSLELDGGREEARRQLEKLGSAGSVRLIQ